MRKSVLFVATTVGLAALLTASCGSSSESAPSSLASVPAVSASVNAGQPACDAVTITPAVITAIGQDQALVRLGGVGCVDGWAVVAPTIGPPDGSEDGQIDITLLFRAQGGSWVEQDRTAVCGTLPTSGGSPAYPTDTEVPLSLWRGACQTN